MLDRGDESVALSDALEIMTINGAISWVGIKNSALLKKGKWLIL